MNILRDVDYYEDYDYNYYEEKKLEQRRIFQDDVVEHIESNFHKIVEMLYSKEDFSAYSLDIHVGIVWDLIQELSNSSAKMPSNQPTIRRG